MGHITALFFSISVPSPSAFSQIIGEDAREFIAGLADNIGLEKHRAATMVTASVAARTRSWLLQAWVGFSILVLENSRCSISVWICNKIYSVLLHHKRVVYLMYYHQIVC